MRSLARALTLATLALAGCATTIGPRELDEDAQRAVHESLEAALRPAVDRALRSPDWLPDFCERGGGGSQTYVLGNTTTAHRYAYVFRCVRSAEDAGATGKGWPLPPEEGGRVLAALSFDLVKTVLESDGEVTHKLVTDSAIEIDYRRDGTTGTVRARLGPDPVPDGHRPEYSRLAVEVHEEARARPAVRARGPLISLLGLALE